MLFVGFIVLGGDVAVVVVVVVCCGGMLLYGCSFSCLGHRSLLS